MNERKGDRRVHRTRRALREALMVLILKKGYETITIEEITTEADVGRTTFYLHYKDKEELYLESIDAAINELVEQIPPVPISAWSHPGNGGPGENQADQPMRMIFRHAADNADLYRIVLRGEGVPRAQERVRRIVSRAVKDFLDLRLAQENLDMNPSVPLEVFVNYFAGSLLGTLGWWLEQDMPYPVETIAEMFQKMAFPGAREVLQISMP